MAVIDVSTLSQTNNMAVYEWQGMAANDTVTALELGGSRPLAMCVQFRGSFGGAVALQGSVDGVTYTTLKDIAGNAISTSSAAIFEVSTACRYLRPSIAANVAATDLLLCVRG